ncbi:Fc.00g062440.m01.CDS01 [Cosmosporella sp. VM-42]
MDSSDLSKPGLNRMHLFRAKRWQRLLLLALVLISIIAIALGLGLHPGLDDDGDDGYGPVVDLGYTKYRGNYLRNGVHEFLQMRFAQAPTGDLRWRAPVEPKQTKGIKKAKKFGPICLGVYQDISSEIDEDCLFVNVWAPSNATADSKLPVMLFIQGGGYTKNANANWNGSQLVETSDRNIVFVNFNYRVGLWGFLAGEEVKNDGDLNVGLLDQRFLMEWVQKYIPLFGGDPDHVVLQGISAGAGAVALQLSAYGGRDDNLFVGAIAESTFLPAQPRLSDLEYQFQRTLKWASCEDAENKMKCLRDKSKRKLQDINRSAPFPGQLENPHFYWTPCIDGDFLQDYPYTLYKNGSFVKVPVLFGACTNEGSAFAVNATTKDEFVSYILANYPNLTATETSSIVDLYPLEAALPNRAAWFSSAARAYGETTFTCPTNNILNAFIRELNTTNTSSASLDTAPVWSYRYNVTDEYYTSLGLGTPHVFEAPAVMGPSMLPPAAVPSSYFAQNAAMVPIMMNYWISFVRALDPNVYRHSSTPQWETWGTGQQRIVFELENSAMESVDRDQRERCEFWERSVDVTQQ